MDKEELIKIIEENKELDIVVMASTDELIDEYGSLLMENLKVEVTDIYNSPREEVIYFDKEDVIDELRDYLADDDRYKNLSDDGYETVMKQKAEEFKKGEKIIIWVY